jgi:hypothetical protein
LSPSLRRFLIAFLVVASAMLIASYAVTQAGRTAVEETHWVWGPAKQYWNACAPELRTGDQTPEPALRRLTRLRPEPAVVARLCGHEDYARCRSGLLDEAADGLRARGPAGAGALSVLTATRPMLSAASDPGRAGVALERLREQAAMAALAASLEGCRVDELLALVAGMNTLADLHAAAGEKRAAAVLRREVARAVQAARIDEP